MAVAALVVGGTLLTLIGLGLRWAQGQRREATERLPAPVRACLHP